MINNSNNRMVINTNVIFPYLQFLAHCLVCLFVFLILFQYGDYDREFHTPGFLAKDLLLPQRVGTHCTLYLSLTFCLSTHNIWQVSVRNKTNNTFHS